jgi:hypothetical protein
MARKTTKQIKKPFTTQIERLVKYAMQKYELKEILEAIVDNIDNYIDRDTFAEIATENSNVQDEVKEKVRHEDKINGWLCIKTESIYDQYKIEEFVQTEIAKTDNQYQLMISY